MAPEGNLRPMRPRKATPQRPTGPLVLGKRIRIALIVAVAIVVIVAAVIELPAFLRRLAVVPRGAPADRLLDAHLDSSRWWVPASPSSSSPSSTATSRSPAAWPPSSGRVEGIDVYESVQQAASRGCGGSGSRSRRWSRVIVGFSTPGSWLTFARAFNAVPFGMRDPIFHHDLSFYVFIVPALQYISTFLFWTLIVDLRAVDRPCTLLLGGIRVEQRRVRRRSRRRLPAATAQERGQPRCARASACSTESGAVAHLSALARRHLHPHRPRLLPQGLGPAVLHLRRRLRRRLHRRERAPAADPRADGRRLADRRPRSSTTPCAAAAGCGRRSPSAAGSSPSSCCSASCRPSTSRWWSTPTSWPRRVRTSPATSPPRATAFNLTSISETPYSLQGRPLGDGAAGQQRDHPQHPPVGPGGAAAQLRASCRSCGPTTRSPP